MGNAALRRRVSSILQEKLHGLVKDVPEELLTLSLLDRSVTLSVLELQERVLEENGVSLPAAIRCARLQNVVVSLPSNQTLRVQAESLQLELEIREESQWLEELERAYQEGEAESKAATLSDFETLFLQQPLKHPGCSDALLWALPELDLDVSSARVLLRDAVSSPHAPFDLTVTAERLAFGRPLVLRNFLDPGPALAFTLDLRLHGAQGMCSSIQADGRELTSVSNLVIGQVQAGEAGSVLGPCGELQLEIEMIRPGATARRDERVEPPSLPQLPPNVGREHKGHNALPQLRLAIRGAGTCLSLTQKQLAQIIQHGQTWGRWFMLLGGQGSLEEPATDVARSYRADWVAKAVGSGDNRALARAHDFEAKYSLLQVVRQRRLAIAETDTQSHKHAFKDPTPAVLFVVDVDLSEPVIEVLRSDCLAVTAREVPANVVLRVSRVSSEHRLLGATPPCVRFILNIDDLVCAAPVSCQLVLYDCCVAVHHDKAGETKLLESLGMLYILADLVDADDAELCPALPPRRLHVYADQLRLDASPNEAFATDLIELVAMAGLDDPDPWQNVSTSGLRKLAYSILDCQDSMPKPQPCNWPIDLAIVPRAPIGLLCAGHRGFLLAQLKLVVNPSPTCSIEDPIIVSKGARVTVSDMAACTRSWVEMQGLGSMRGLDIACWSDLSRHQSEGQSSVQTPLLLQCTGMLCDVSLAHIDLSVQPLVLQLSVDDISVLMSLATSWQSAATKSPPAESQGTRASHSPRGSPGSPQSPATQLSTLQVEPSLAMTEMETVTSQRGDGVLQTISPHFRVHLHLQSIELQVCGASLVGVSGCGPTEATNTAHQSQWRRGQLLVLLGVHIGEQRLSLDVRGLQPTYGDYRLDGIRVVAPVTANTDNMGATVTAAPLLQCGDAERRGEAHRAAAITVSIHQNDEQESAIAVAVAPLQLCLHLDAACGFCFQVNELKKAMVSEPAPTTRQRAARRVSGADSMQSSQPQACEEEQRSGLVPQWLGSLVVAMPRIDMYLPCSPTEGLLASLQLKLALETPTRFRLLVIGPSVCCASPAWFHGGNQSDGKLATRSGVLSLYGDEPAPAYLHASRLSVEAEWEEPTDLICVKVTLEPVHVVMETSLLALLSGLSTKLQRLQSEGAKIIETSSPKKPVPRGQEPPAMPLKLLAVLRAETLTVSLVDSDRDVEFCHVLVEDLSADCRWILVPPRDVEIDVLVVTACEIRGISASVRPGPNELLTPLLEPVRIWGKNLGSKSTKCSVSWVNVHFSGRVLGSLLHGCHGARKYWEQSQPNVVEDQASSSPSGSAFAPYVSSTSRLPGESDFGSPRAYDSSIPLDLDASGIRVDNQLGTAVRLESSGPDDLVEVASGSFALIPSWIGDDPVRRTDVHLHMELPDGVHTTFVVPIAEQLHGLSVQVISDTSDRAPRAEDHLVRTRAPRRILVRQRSVSELNLSSLLFVANRSGIDLVVVPVGEGGEHGSVLWMEVPTDQMPRPVPFWWLVANGRSDAPTLHIGLKEDALENLEEMARNPASAPQVLQSLVAKRRLLPMISKHAKQQLHRHQGKRFKDYYLPAHHMEMLRGSGSSSSSSRRAHLCTCTYGVCHGLPTSSLKPTLFFNLVVQPLIVLGNRLPNGLRITGGLKRFAPSNSPRSRSLSHDTGTHVLLRPGEDAAVLHPGEDLEPCIHSPLGLLTTQFKLKGLQHRTKTTQIIRFTSPVAAGTSFEVSLCDEIVSEAMDAAWRGLKVYQYPSAARRLIFYTKYWLVNRRSDCVAFSRPAHLIHSMKTTLPTGLNQVPPNTLRMVSEEAVGQRRYLHLGLVGRDVIGSFAPRPRAIDVRQPTSGSVSFPGETQSRFVGYTVRAAPLPFYRTLIVEVVRRYMLVNKKGHALVVQEPSRLPHVLKPGQVLPFDPQGRSPSLTITGNVDRRNTAFGGSSIESLSESEESMDLADGHGPSFGKVQGTAQFSASFSLALQGTARSFQLMHRISPDEAADGRCGTLITEQPLGSGGTTPEAPQSRSLWCITAVDLVVEDGGILVRFSDPPRPDFRLVNRTTWHLALHQAWKDSKQTAPNLRLAPECCLPFGWFEPGAKRLALEMEVSEDRPLPQESMLNKSLTRHLAALHSIPGMAMGRQGVYEIGIVQKHPKVLRMFRELDPDVQQVQSHSSLLSTGNQGQWDEEFYVETRVVEGCREVHVFPWCLLTNHKHSEMFVRLKVTRSLFSAADEGLSWICNTRPVPAMTYVRGPIRVSPGDSVCLSRDDKGSTVEVEVNGRLSKEGDGCSFTSKLLWELDTSHTGFSGYLQHPGSGEGSAHDVEAQTATTDFTFVDMHRDMISNFWMLDLLPCEGPPYCLENTTPFTCIVKNYHDTGEDGLLARLVSNPLCETELPPCDETAVVRRAPFLSTMGARGGHGSVEVQVLCKQGQDVVDDFVVNIDAAGQHFGEEVLVEVLLERPTVVVRITQRSEEGVVFTHTSSLTSRGARRHRHPHERLEQARVSMARNLQQLYTMRPPVALNLAGMTRVLGPYQITPGLRASQSSSTDGRSSRKRRMSIRLQSLPQGMGRHLVSVMPKREASQRIPSFLAGLRRRKVRKADQMESGVYMELLLEGFGIALLDTAAVQEVAYMSIQGVQCHHKATDSTFTNLEVAVASVQIDAWAGIDGTVVASPRRTDQNILMLRARWSTGSTVGQDHRGRRVGHWEIQEARITVRPLSIALDTMTIFRLGEWIDGLSRSLAASTTGPVEQQQTSIREPDLTPSEVLMSEEMTTPRHSQIVASSHDGERPIKEDPPPDASPSGLLGFLGEDRKVQQMKEGLQTGKWLSSDSVGDVDDAVAGELRFTPTQSGEDFAVPTPLFVQKLLVDRIECSVSVSFDGRQSSATSEKLRALDYVLSRSLPFDLSQARIRLGRSVSWSILGRAIATRSIGAVRLNREFYDRGFSQLVAVVLDDYGGAIWYQAHWILGAMPLLLNLPRLLGEIKRAGKLALKAVLRCSLGMLIAAFLLVVASLVESLEGSFVSLGKTISNLACGRAPVALLREPESICRAVWDMLFYGLPWHIWNAKRQCVRGAKKAYNSRSAVLAVRFPFVTVLRLLVALVAAVVVTLAKLSQLLRMILRRAAYWFSPQAAVGAGAPQPLRPGPQQHLMGIPVQFSWCAVSILGAAGLESFAGSGRGIWRVRPLPEMEGWLLAVKGVGFYLMCFDKASTRKPSTKPAPLSGRAKSGPSRKELKRFKSRKSTSLLAVDRPYLADDSIERLAEDMSARSVWEAIGTGWHRPILLRSKASEKPYQAVKLQKSEAGAMRSLSSLKVDEEPILLELDSLAAAYAAFYFMHHCIELEQV